MRGGDCLKLGDFLRKMRLKAHVDVNDLVQELNDYGIEKTAKTIYGWENGVCEPKTSVFMVLMRIYDVCVGDLNELYNDEM